MGIELIQVSLKEKLVSAIGSAIAILLVILITHAVVPLDASCCVVASMGASAVLLFAVPHGQLSQPWPVFGGHFVSALVGVLCARWISSPALAAALAVGLSIGLMHQLKCIHPPGGASAFTAVLGGTAIRDLGLSYVLVPIALNALVMLMLAIVINYPFAWRRYPSFLIRRIHTRTDSTQVVSVEEHERFLEAIRSLDSFVDISEEDLIYLSRSIASHYGIRFEAAPSSRSPLLVQPSTAHETWLMRSVDEVSH